MKPQLSRQSASVVLRGAFGPAMFQPQWFSNQGLIRTEEADDVNIGIVSVAVTQFRVGWLELHVTEDRFQAKTAQEQFYEALRDVVVGVLEILRPANLHMMGINRDFLYEVESEKAWHGVRRSLTPPSVWEGILIQPAMATVVMQGQRADNRDGYVRVLVQSAPQVSYGIAIDVNDHYELSGEAADHTEQAVKILGQCWHESLQQARSRAEQIVSLGGDR